ncbi:MAG: metal-dependent transcriptional regulator [Spirochaetales bacterium]|nr:metal-dependent transcriptional regulator [Spirochaetales bacterium]
MSNEEKSIITERNLGKSLEDYIEAVYDLHKEQGQARISDISSRLGMAKPSVNAAIKRLSALGLVTHERYGDVDLTPDGVRLAANVRHKHNVLLDFLVRLIGVDSDIAENEACSIEHSLCDDTMTKLEAFISKYDNH